MSILVCFAVPQESRFFTSPPQNRVEVISTGMGSKNAVEAIQRTCATSRPDQILTCGFAGGLAPSLATGHIVWSADESFPLRSRLALTSATHGHFHCDSRVAITTREKQALRASTGADAVEMESGAIRDFCRAHQIPSATVRVILDPAGEDLPLDFNALVNADYRMNYFKLACHLALSPRTIPRLLRFNSQVKVAARSLGGFLEVLLRDGP